MNYWSKNKGWIIPVGIVVFIGLFILMSYRSTYNTAIKLQEEINGRWGNVQAAYQRRADLIPNLVGTVKGAAKNEKEILTQVTQARAGIVNAKTPEDLEMMGRKINTAINLAYEAYPEIRSSANFLGLQAQLEGTENRINTERVDYNGAVKEYNTHIRGFFNSMFLNPQTFPIKEEFKASAGSEKAPSVNFE